MISTHKASFVGGAMTLTPKSTPVGVPDSITLPKLSADFTTGTYKADGATKTFADLFTFNRAGKAWLVKDTGLQEYAVDVPRLDNGLLIEQSATNYSKHESRGVVENVAYLNFNGAWKIIEERFKGWSAYSTLDGAYVWSIYATPQDGALRRLQMQTDDASSYKETVSIGMRHYVSTLNVVGLTNPAATFGRIGSLLYAPQFEHGLLPTSFINKQGSAPVTRPADFLLNKITGTTVTGDWDSTLTLSIVAGNLVHSGYGRIRSLEIN